MKTESDPEPNRFRDKLALIKSILEVAAILLAGMWALFNFKIKDAPTLQQSLTASPRLTVDSVRPDIVVFTYSLSLQNIGKTTFDIDSMRINIWKVKKEDIIGKTPFVAEDYMASHPVPSITYSSNNNLLIRSYPPELVNTASYCFYLPRDTTNAILFYHEVYGSGKSWLGREKLIDKGSQWILDLPGHSGE